MISDILSMTALIVNNNYLAYIITYLFGIYEKNDFPEASRNLVRSKKNFLYH